MSLAEKIVRAAMRSGFDEAVGNVSYNRRSYLKIANSKIDSIVDKYTVSGMLFVVSRKRVFFTNIQTLDDRSIREAVERSKKAMSFAVPKEDYFGIAEGPFKYKQDGKPDNGIEHYTTRTLNDIAEDALDGAVGGGARNVAGAVFIAHSRTELATSKGVRAEGSEAMARLSLRAFGHSLSFQNFEAEKYLKNLHAKEFGKETAETLGDVDKTGKIESGMYDVIYLPSPAGSLVSNVNDAACISSIETGSFLPKQLGKAVASKDITIYDCGMAKDAVDSSPYDDEGYPTQKTKVIGDGKLKSHLHNYSTAKKYNVKSTGNAGLVVPDANTMLFEYRKRVKSVDELIGKVDRGVLVTNTWYTRFGNYVSGDFSTVPRDLALYIKNGEVKHAIRQKDIGSIVGIRISDNMLRMLNNIEYAVDDTKQTTSWDTGNYYFMPTILVKDVKVTTV